jgi:methylated-DNA-[protein]-cysteine S-methyltransferase
MLAAAEDEALTGLWFAGQKYFPRAPLGTENPELPLFRALREWLKEYFSRRNPVFPEALKPYGTAFQREVWDRLREIPYGETRTYGGIAIGLGSPRAVGGAVARNPISLLIPCHRVIGSSGNLTGYAGGLSRKRALLDLEGG